MAAALAAEGVTVHGDEAIVTADRAAARPVPLTTLKTAIIPIHTT